jgi:hypothetical protein
MCTTLAYQVTEGRDWHVHQSSSSGGWSDSTYGFVVTNANNAPRVTEPFQNHFEVESDTILKLSCHLGTTAVIFRHTFNKLVASYVGPPGQLLGSIYNMLQRYDTAGLLRSVHVQLVLPRNTFRMLSEKFGVDHECFACPTGRCCATYNSQFPDTDNLFGSEGSFYGYYPNRDGSFFCHPPPVQQDILHTYEHVVELLGIADISGHAATFVVMAPAMERKPHLERSCSKYVSGARTLERGRHVMMVSTSFRTSTSQHMSPLNETMCLSSSDVDLVWLQNDLGRKKWPVTVERMEIVVSTLHPAPMSVGHTGGGGN